MDVGRLKIGKTSIFLICDAPPPLVVADVCTYCDYRKVNREEEEEDEEEETKKFV